MIVGDGDIASKLIDRQGFIFFASGVSKSLETRESEYQQEIDLLLKQDRDKHIVYFSSLCIFYSKTRYARHKKEMEELIKKIFSHYTIMRLGNITWGTNPHTILNSIKRRAKLGETVPIPDEYRYLVTPKEFQYWMNLIPEWNCEMNIPGKRIKIKRIIEQIQKKYGR